MPHNPFDTLTRRQWLAACSALAAPGAGLAQSAWPAKPGAGGSW